MYWPPFTSMHSPVIHPAPGDAKKRTAAATSPGRPTRAIGIVFKISSMPGPFVIRMVGGVSISPGQTAFTLAWAASSRRSTITTSAPAWASARALAPPMAPPPPVTSATRPLRSPTSCLQPRPHLLRQDVERPHDRRIGRVRDLQRDVAAAERLEAPQLLDDARHRAADDVAPAQQRHVDGGPVHAVDQDGEAQRAGR